MCKVAIHLQLQNVIYMASIIIQCMGHLYVNFSGIKPSRKQLGLTWVRCSVWVLHNQIGDIHHVPNDIKTQKAFNWKLWAHGVLLIGWIHYNIITYWSSLFCNILFLLLSVRLWIDFINHKQREEILKSKAIKS